MNDNQYNAIFSCISVTYVAELNLRKSGRDLTAGGSSQTSPSESVLCVPLNTYKFVDAHEGEADVTLYISGYIHENDIQPQREV